MTKYAMAVAFVILARGIAAPVAAEAGSITTAGYGEMQVAPDVVDIRFEVAAVAETPTAAAAAVAVQSQAVQDVLDKLGIRANEVVTTSFRVNEKIEHNRRTGEVTPLGHEAVHAIKLTITDFKKISPIVDAAMQAGASRLSGLDFRVTDPGPANDAALEAAVSRALGKASIMASAAGGRLGALVEMNSERYSGDAIACSMDTGGQRIPLVIFPDKIVVRVTVSASWEFSED